MTRVVHHSKGYRELFTGAAALAEVRARAEKIAEAAGDGYEMRSSEPRRRARAAVVTTTAKAVRDNATNQTLLYSLDAGR